MQDGRAPRIKNRAPAAIQITAEQLLREAQERQETAFRAPKQRVEDFEELHEYRGRKRKEFEERIRRTRGSIKEWLQYANWEASQNEFARSRSVFERALDVDPRSIQLWLSYTEMELKSRNVQHARNLFDRAVTLLPRVDQLWYKYVYLEELLQNVPGARQVFERWMQWEPDDKAWQAYIKLEERYQELDRASAIYERWIAIRPEPRAWVKWGKFEEDRGRWEPDDKAWQAYIKLEERYQELDRASAIYERWIAIRPEPRAWVKWGKFEEDRGRVDKAREVFQTALEFYGDDEEQVEKAQAVFSAFARMETRLKEYERARVIYKFALSRIPRSKSAGLYASYTKFEKQHGTRNTLENTVLGKRRIQYEEEVSKDGRNYDAWFDFTRLEESAYTDLKEDGAAQDEMDAAVARVREVYERAVAQVPPGGEKRHWRRYIFLWLNYALFEEIETKDYPRARQIYQTAIKLVPHKQFTFAKLWLMFAKFEVRRLDLPAARKILGTAIGMCPKEALFKGYIDLEIELREFDRARTLYEKYLEFDPSNSSAWIKFAELEAQLQDFPRTRAIFELGVSQSPLSMPEILWKAYIDFEIEEGERETARALYERLISLSGHVKVWISYALFEAEPIPVPRAEREEEEEDEDEEVKTVPGDPALARQVFERAYKDLKNKQLKSERVALLNAWKLFEEAHGNAEEVKKVEGMMPIVTKKRIVDAETGQTVEDYVLVFADDEKESNPSTFKFLQMAHAWKQAAGGGGAGAFSNLTAATQEESSSEDEESDEEEEEGRKRGGDHDDDSMDSSGEETKKKRGPAPDSSKDGPVFPQEIFGVIISHLGWAADKLRDGYYDGDSNADLKKCSLVCKSFADLCRPYIFSSLDITFDHGGPVPSLDRFARLLAHKPILADYVKSLTCIFDATNIEAKQVSGLTVLFKLPNIQKLVIPAAYGDISGHYTLHYTPESHQLTYRKIFDHFMTSQKLTTMELSNMWYPPLIRLFSSPALRNLEFRRCLIDQSDWKSLPDICIPANGFNLTRLYAADVIDFPFSILSCCPSLEVLEMENIIPRDENSTPLLRSRPFSSYGRLRTLSLGGNFKWLNFCKWLDVAGVGFFRELQDLKIRMEREENVPGIRELLKHVRILDKLHLKISASDLRPIECIRSSRPTLKDLSLDYESSRIVETSGFVDDISSILSQMGPYSVLEDFSIQIALFDVDIMVLKARLVDSLKRLSNTLLHDTNETFAQLRSVSFTIQTFSRANIDFEMLQKVVDEPFKGFWVSKRIAFTRKICEFYSSENYCRKNSVLL
ncbi:hypothetical protein CVT24_004616 [Panaeolus cyanescens]|uniref:Pre-mRNA-splicing factor CLF1 n=1 Tax=Panaeolus cyanescens TaxID=181874 RepID=A0A409YBG4_9AGAR|nr:hypothetical protein CVT24_004616 [Panaeolus cyanescens]